MSATSGQSNKVKIGVLGASGYTGAELVRLLLCHPQSKIDLLTADRRAGKSMTDVFAQFTPFALPTLTAVEDADWQALGLDVAFCALPHGTTQKVIKELLTRAPGTKVIDLSADFRLPIIERAIEFIRGLCCARLTPSSSNECASRARNSRSWTNW